MKRMATIFLFFIISLLPFFLEANLIVGIAGGSGSGKTTLAANLLEHFGDKALLIEQDAYYRDWSHLIPERREVVNFDHPDSLEFSLMRKQLLNLKSHVPIEKPQYDFVSHTRKKETIFVEPKKLVIVEGILVLAVPEIRDLLDIKIFVDADGDVRVLRRLERDMTERGRSAQSVIQQYLSTVKPMHTRHVEPSKSYADVVVSGVRENTPFIIHLVEGALQFNDRLAAK